MEEKVVSFYKEDFTEEQWEIICDEFEADSNGTFIYCLVDLATMSQGI